jgi:hypothetical protein
MLRAQLAGQGKAIAIVGAALLLGLSFNLLFFEQGLGVNAVIYLVLIVGLLAMLSRATGRHLSERSILISAGLAFFGSMMFVRASPFLNFLNVLLCIFLLLLLAETAFKQKLEGSYLRVLLVPLQFVRPAAATLGEATASLGTMKGDGKTKQIVKGVLLTLPLLIIFGMLFSSADLVFQKYITNVIDFQLSPEIFGRVILIALVTFVFAGAYAYTLRTTKTSEAVPAAVKPPKITLGRIELTILLGSINAFFLIFVVLQLAYLFGGESIIHSQNFTYAEYARRGFFELIAVAVLTLGLLRATELSMAKSPDLTRVFQILGGALILQVVVIMVSAFKRLSLYEHAYGFTNLRLYSHIFIILLGCLALLFLYKILSGNRARSMATGSLLLVVAFLAGINMLNPEAFIARQNIARFNSADKIDSYYLSTLSADAVPELTKALEGNNQKLKQELSEPLARQWHTSSNFTTDKHWQSFNLSRDKSEELLTDRFGEQQKDKYWW